MPWPKHTMSKVYVKVIVTAMILEWWNDLKPAVNVVLNSLSLIMPSTWAISTVVLRNKQAECGLTSSWSFWLLSRPSPNSAIQIHNKDSPWRSRKDFRQDCEWVFFQGKGSRMQSIVGGWGWGEEYQMRVLKRAHKEDKGVHLHSPNPRNYFD